MSIELCQSTCLGLGYILAGLEYADECCKFQVKFSLLVTNLVQIAVTL
jgi:glucan 1,3-beta-glucosidase